MWSQEAHSGHVLTLANSIIGVSILAMPYCFKQCGVLLAIIILLVTNLISRLTCHFLMKSAIIARRKTFENLAYYVFGELGKFFIEVGMIGFLVGTCIAFFVVMGDLGPEIIAEITGQETTSTMRSTILLVLALFCVLPLGLQRNVDSLAGISKATIGFYFGLVVKVIIDAMPHIFYGDWYNNVNLWRPAGVLQCLPIFSMALSCQTQLFEIYQVVHNPSLEKMNCVIKTAINICTLVYFLVGFFGYVAFANQNFTGNILLSFESSLLTSFIKIGFILSVAFSFPLAILPCRASAHSLIYRQGMYDGTSNDYIPETRFKALTLIIVCVSLVIGILISNIEFVLGLVGSSIGIMICILFPVMSFIYVSKKNTNEMLLAKGILVIGLTIMVLGTYENLHHLQKLQDSAVVYSPATEKGQLKLISNEISKDIKNNIIVKQQVNQTRLDIRSKVTDSPEIRHEPPQPVEQVEPVDQSYRKDSIKNDEKLNEVQLELRHDDVIKPEKPKKAEAAFKKNISSPDILIPDLQSKLQKKNDSPNGRVDIEAIKKDDEEIMLEQQGEDQAAIKDHQSILEQIQKQNEVQEEIVKQQKKLIEAIEKQQKEKAQEEKVKAEIKAVKEIESIALRAIEKISGDTKENKKIVAELEKNVQEKVIANEYVLEQKINLNTSVREEVKINELKQMNSLLTAKIKQNNVTQKPPSETKIPMRSLDINGLANSLIANRTNMGPLLASLGQEDINKYLKPVNNSSALPLPLIVSIAQEHAGNFSSKKNISGKEPKDNSSGELKEKINLEDEIKVMRRDILGYVTSRRRRR